MRFCDCGCEHCYKQTETHEPCDIECNAEMVEQTTRHVRDIIEATRYGRDNLVVPDPRASLA